VPMLAGEMTLTDVVGFSLIAIAFFVLLISIAIMIRKLRNNRNS
jgi:uncharacterized protein YoxC